MPNQISSKCLFYRRRKLKCPSGKDSPQIIPFFSQSIPNVTVPPYSVTTVTQDRYCSKSRNSYMMERPNVPRHFCIFCNLQFNSSLVTQPKLTLGAVRLGLLLLFVNFVNSPSSSLPPFQLLSTPFTVTMSYLR